MKIRLLLPCLLFVLACAAPALRADNSPSTSAPAAPVKADEKTDLEKQMDKIGHAARALKKQIPDATKNADSLQLVAKIRAAAVASTEFLPAKADDFTGAERDKFIADYQAGMKQFIAGVDKLAAALKADDNVEAAKDLKSLFALEKQDHHEFRRPQKS